MSSLSPAPIPGTADMPALVAQLLAKRADLARQLQEVEITLSTISAVTGFPLPDNGSGSANQVLNDNPLELISSPSAGSARKAKPADGSESKPSKRAAKSSKAAKPRGSRPSKRPVSPPEVEPLAAQSPGSTPEPTAESQPSSAGSTFSLQGNMRSGYRRLSSPRDAVIQALEKLGDGVTSQQLLEELYGKTLSKSLRPRAQTALKGELTRGIKAGLWQGQDGQDGTLTYRLAPAAS